MQRGTHILSHPFTASLTSLKKKCHTWTTLTFPSIPTPSTPKLLSMQVLCLTAAGKSREDVKAQKSTFRVGLNSDMQWSVFNFPLAEMRAYDSFKPTPYFMKTYVPFFSQYGQTYNPWSPDSRSFIFVTASGLCHTPLVGSKHSVGEGKWTNQGATFGTWSRM